ncbi:pantoate--beta-alanine ligase [Bacillus sp. 2205SS5-2]|uniref:pantoate--beta-alanine ligase n=1 Tax=Bacillus sp. 2205SS5-2 TaxID=3109031 RepID=UPI00300431AB
MMKITTIQELRQTISSLKQKNRTIGFVPTMGFLHEGHLSLMQEARKSHDVVVMSIFVNPLQFGPNEDFDRYPRNMEKDEQLARDHGVDVLFLPSVEEMYPEPASVQMKVIERVNVLCGRTRVGHFDGVAIVVSKLFHLVQPDVAYFGQKDAQQVAVIEGLVNDFNFPLTVVSVPTIREEDGLAKSSRNVYLSQTEREKAAYLYQSLLLGKQLIEQGKRNPLEIRQEIILYLEEHTNGMVDYVEIYSYPQLDSMKELQGKIILALAVHFQKARLIDNIIIDISQPGRIHNV